MKLDDCIAEIVRGIKIGRFVNEAAVSQGIVMPVLQSLGWPVFDPQVVAPEYAVRGRRVDFALCPPPESKPLVFLEVKRIGQQEGGDRQLFEYAFHEGGVPMAILTDGQEWSFFLPGERGDYSERCVYKLDILERDIEESVHRLKRYLSYDAIKNEEAFRSAKTDYKKAAAGRTMKQTIPQAWSKLVEDQDELLVELIAEKAEDLCGYKPNAEMVGDFLEGFIKTKIVDNKRKSHSIQNVQRDFIEDNKKASRSRKNKKYGFILNNEETPCRNARDVLIKVLEEFTRRDPTFPERFMARKHGSKRRYMSKDKYELYPGRRDLCEDHSCLLLDTYWVGTNFSRTRVLKILQIAAEVANLKVDSQIFFFLGGLQGEK